MGMLVLLLGAGCSSAVGDNGADGGEDPSQRPDGDASTTHETASDDTGSSTAVDARVDTTSPPKPETDGGTSGTDSAPIPDASSGAHPIIAPTCADGTIYASEALPVRTDITDLMSRFDASKKLDWSIQVLFRRYPTGATILERANNDTGCFDIGVRDAIGAKDVIAGLRTSVHECGHMVDLNKETFVFSPTSEMKCNFSLARGTPPRNVIVKDEFQALWPDDSFKELYLDKYGDQDFVGLITETLQYINTLATSYAFYDVTTFDPVARDGVHAFQWYVTRYLRQIRTNHPAAYDKLVGDRCWRNLILTGWGRAQRYLVASKGMKDLSGKDDALLETLMTEPKLVDEIHLLRVKDGCVAR
jgi:hypothetical protein